MSPLKAANLTGRFGVAVALNLAVLYVYYSTPS
ncbi:hypothetical protein BH18ACT12_BH18ACT12_21300 [soil metagenome]